MHTDLPLIPFPRSVDAAPGARRGDLYQIGPDASLTVQPGNGAALATAGLLEGALRRATGMSLPVRVTDAPGPGGVHLSDEGARPEPGGEGYRLLIDADGVRIGASSGAGFFYGGQTLLQLLPPVARSTRPLALPRLLIHDEPRYPWRGMMLDVARHFFAPDEVKRLINLLAHYKMNRLHLHLSDDQGWRIEIPGWPELTGRGAESAVGGAAGGFYSSADYADLVAYAARRHVTIVPEIDMPGHVNAALYAYPQLNPSGPAPELYTGTDVGFSSLDVDADETWRFVADVVQALAVLTPGPYLHIGGDEADATNADAYRRFVARAHDLVRAAGKQMVGWQEIASVAELYSGDPAPIVQYWKGGAVDAAAARGARWVLSPADRLYLDMKYDEETLLGLTWAGTVSVKRAYDWDPETLLPDLPAAHVLGVEAPLWTETITTRSELDTMVFPRLLGCAEIGWSPAAARAWESYRARLAQHGERLAAQGVAFYAAPEVPWVE